jgi:hypothetical protein
MKKLRTIYLPNRYIKKIPVHEIAPDEWKIDLTKSHFMRYIYDKSPDVVKAVDPDGGPFIGIGDMLDDKPIVSITKDGVLICHH